MDATAEIIREQMEETKSQLSEKLVSLESQVSETVASTGTAVNATVESVQETVETVTQAVHSAVRTVGNAFDFQRQIDKHPWLVVGGAFVVGVLAADYLAGPEGDYERAATPPLLSPSTRSTNPGNGQRRTEAATTDREPPAWHQLKSGTMSALLKSVQDVFSLAAPQVVDFLAGQRGTDQVSGSDDHVKLRGSPGRPGAV